MKSLRRWLSLLLLWLLELGRAVGAWCYKAVVNLRGAREKRKRRRPWLLLLLKLRRALAFLGGLKLGRLALPVLARLVAIGALSAALAGVGTWAVYYQITKEPISNLLYRLMRAPIARLPGGEPITAAVRMTPPRYLFSIYGVHKPMGVAVDPSGQRIYVTEGGGERQIRLFDATGKQLAVFSPPGTSPGTRAPSYAGVDGNGIVYVSDRLRGTIDTYWPEGAYLGSFSPTGNPDMQWLPLGVSFDRQGNLYVTDLTQGHHRVMIFDKEGKLKLEFGKQGERRGEFLFPNATAVDSRGRIFVSNSNAGRIDVFAPNGAFLDSYARGSGRGTVGLPRGMAVDNEGRLYVVDTVSHQVNVYDVSATMEFMFSFGALGMGDGEFSFPNGLALDRSGKLYITDRENDRVQVWGY